MKNLADQIVGSIKEKRVAPIPRWRYVAKKTLFWSLTLILTAFGALSLALAVYLIQTIDWSVYPLLGYSSLHSFAMSAFPYAFVLLLVIFLVLSYYFYRQTPKGHRINLSVLLTLFLFALVSGSVLFHILGVSREAHFWLARVPYYHQMMFTPEREWSQPEKGLLWGEVISADANGFSLRDMNGKGWMVFYGTAMPKDVSGFIGKDVRIVGKMKNIDEFQADQIKGWNGAMNCNGSRNDMMGGGMMRR